MSPVPLVSIVVPVFNDAATIAAALESATSQTLADVEIICVDDASNDDTAAIIEAFVTRDPRVRLIRHPHNLTAFESRRTGVTAAAAAYVMFLDGDDELSPRAAELAVAKARAADADVVGFGVTVVERDGRTGSPYEVRLQPPQQPHVGTGLLRALFPEGRAAQGQLWRFLIRTRVLQDAYALLPSEVKLSRINDLPLLFLVAALAETYVAVPDKLYRYYFGRGGSGFRVDSVERARFYASAITSVESIQPAIATLSARYGDPDLLQRTYESVRLAIIGYVCSQIVEKGDRDILDAAIQHLLSVTSGEDVLRAATRFYPTTLSALKPYAEQRRLEERRVRSILLATSTLRTGGVSAVLTSQAHYLRNAGYRVVVVARNGESDSGALPPDVPFVELTSRDLGDQLRQWGQICREYDVDIVIDHQILYMDPWPEFALAARAEGAATIGWLHNFVGRPVYDGNDRLLLIERWANTLAALVVLSPLDVAYFRLRGIDHVSYLPNPPSPILLETPRNPAPKPPPSGRVELLWWGRLEQRTKQVRELVAVGVELSRLGVDFSLRIIGPDWDDVTAKKLNAFARRRGVGDRVRAVGPLHGDALMTAIDAADAFVSTSIIEGYQLTIAEAQSRGLPVFMYDLPWLTLVRDNAGVVSVPQGESFTLARRIAEVAKDPERFTQLSRASRDAAERARSFDFDQLYQQVVTATLPEMFSPEPTLADARELLGLLSFYASRSRGTQRTLPGRAAVSNRLWQVSAPFGRTLLRRLPVLRPLAHRAKDWLGAR